MNRLAPRHATRRPTRPAERQTTVCVVDPKTDDYRAWREFAKPDKVRLTLLTDPEEALRRARSGAVDLWVINTKLPGLSGFDLCSMLRSRSSNRAAVCLVADEYSPDAERAAWAARASMFLCKGEHAAWIADWLHSRSVHKWPSPQSGPVANRSEQALRLPVGLLSPDLQMRTFRA